MTISAFIMFGLPWIDATLVPNDAGMIAAIVLLFVVNPLYSIAVGMFAGKNIKTSWWFPAITAIFFLVENGYFLKIHEPAFLLYCGCYLIIGIVSMFISAYAKNRKR
ncbi:MAG: hypothetical protein UIE84_11575 [Christensenellales bacterium]|nr:hypothetical protein [Christensenellales bacterium]